MEFSARHFDGRATHGCHADKSYSRHFHLHCHWPQPAPWHCPPGGTPQSSWKKECSADGKQMALENSRYKITMSTDDQSVTIFDKQSGKTDCRVWGDPHFNDGSGANLADFKGDMLLKLDDGTQVYFDTRTADNREPTKGYTGATYVGNVTVTSPESGTVQVDGMLEGRLRQNFELPRGPWSPFPDAATIGSGGEAYMTVRERDGKFYTADGQAMNQCRVNMFDAINQPDGSIAQQLMGSGVCCHADPDENRQLLNQLEGLLRSLFRACPHHNPWALSMLMQGRGGEPIPTYFGPGRPDMHHF